jgi:NADP-dependent 3-hydroxy acid dehydrogenase YdfG
MSKGQLEGKVAIVTGGRGGIGRGICERFSNDGARVIAADLAQGEISLPNNVCFELLDVTDEMNVQKLMEKISSEYGKLDIVINTAAIEIEKTIENTSLEQWNNIFAINVTGTFLVSKYAIPLLRKNGGGSIVNFGSYDGFIADPELSAYCPKVQFMLLPNQWLVTTVLRTSVSMQSAQVILIRQCCKVFSGQKAILKVLKKRYVRSIQCAAMAHRLILRA